MKNNFIFDFSLFKNLDEETINTLTVLSNGYIAVRGDYEFAKSRFGTFVSGVYSYVPVYYRELVNLPRITSVDILFEGEPLSLRNSRGVQKILNAYEGTLTHKFIWNTKKGPIEYKSIRFIHKDIKPLFVMKLNLKSKSAKGRLLISSYIDLDMYNPSYNENIHIRLFKKEYTKEINDKKIIGISTCDKTYNLNFGLINKVNKNYEKIPIFLNEKIGDNIYVDLNKGDELEIIKYVAVNNSFDSCHDTLKESEYKDFRHIYSLHREKWHREWNELGLKIKADKEFEKALIFNTFHLLQLYNEKSDYFILPARGLHGFGYRGHVFWDADIYCLPFYLFIKPDAAKKMLKFRFKNLTSAKINAKKNGYEGAQFPWESADDGFEATPEEVPLDILGKAKVIIETGKLEHHISADIAYAVDLYYRYTADEEFMTNYGLKIIFETARFWASRVCYDPSKRAYAINDVIGPDEYHVHVNNSFYTNLMAKHNLEIAIDYYEKCLKKEEWRNCLIELSVHQNETLQWKNIASNIYLPCNEDGLCEEFEGYSILEDCILPNGVIGEKSLPLSEKNKIGKNKLIKQADVVLGMFLLRDKFKKETIMKNYDYYIKRTTHASSLSLPAYACVAAYLGKIEEAYRMLKHVSMVDLENIFGNTPDGFHVASAGGLWMALLFGFLRINIDVDGKLNIQPSLPRNISRLELKFSFKGKKFLLKSSNENFSIIQINNDVRK
jgi:kojibiose phosphorylase